MSQTRIKIPTVAPDGVSALTAVNATTSTIASDSNTAHFLSNTASYSGQATDGTQPLNPTTFNTFTDSFSGGVTGTLTSSLVTDYASGITGWSHQGTLTDIGVGLLTAASVNHGLSISCTGDLQLIGATSAVITSSTGPAVLQSSTTSAQINATNSVVTSNTKAFQIFDTSATTTLSLVRAASNATNSTNKIFYECVNSSGTSIGKIAGLTNTTTAFTGTSDARLKQNIASFSALDTISALNPVEFEWKSDPGQKSHGFIAQELVLVIPEAVVKGDDSLTENGELANPWGADYSKVVPHLTKAIQELHEKVKVLEAQLAAKV